MEESFKLEIISPEKIIFSDSTKMTVLPSYEGEMSILKNHISIITFLRPGIVKAQTNENNFSQFFVEDGIVEFKDNNLTILTSSISNINDMKKDRIDTILSEAEKNSQDKEISDQQKYLADQKIEVLKSIN